jgi:hypothetical protein
MSGRNVSQHIGFVKDNLKARDTQKELAARPRYVPRRSSVENIRLLPQVVPSRYGPSRIAPGHTGATDPRWPLQLFRPRVCEKMLGCSPDVIRWSNASLTSACEGGGVSVQTAIVGPILRDESCTHLRANLFAGPDISLPMR